MLLLTNQMKYIIWTIKTTKWIKDLTLFNLISKNKMYFERQLQQKNGYTNKTYFKI